MVFLAALEAGGLYSGGQNGWLRALLQLVEPSLCPHRVGGQRALWGLLYKGTPPAHEDSTLMRKVLPPGPIS